jgi:hypothetical protein
MGAWRASEARGRTAAGLAAVLDRRGARARGAGVPTPTGDSDDLLREAPYVPRAGGVSIRFFPLVPLPPAFVRSCVRDRLQFVRGDGAAGPRSGAPDSGHPPTATPQACHVGALRPHPNFPSQAPFSGGAWPAVLHP